MAMVEIFLHNQEIFFTKALQIFSVPRRTLKNTDRHHYIPDHHHHGWQLHCCAKLKGHSADRAGRQKESPQIWKEKSGQKYSTPSRFCQLHHRFGASERGLGVSEHWVSFDKMPSEKESRDIPLKKWEFYACVLLPEWCRFEETFWGRTSRCLELNLGWCGTRLAQSWCSGQCFHLAWSSWAKRASLIIQANLVEMRNNQYSAQTVNRSEWGHVLRWDS